MKLATILMGIDDIEPRQQLIVLSKAILRVSEAVNLPERKPKKAPDDLINNLKAMAEETNNWYTITQLIIQSKISGVSNTQFGLALKNIGAERSRRKNKDIGNVSTMYRICFKPTF